MLHFFQKSYQLIEAINFQAIVIKAAIKLKQKQEFIIKSTKQVKDINIQLKSINESPL